MWDVVIVGGSVAGLSAALVLGRAKRGVLVVDSGSPCNRFSHASHGFLTRDGIAPSDLLATARAQLQPYPSVSLRSDRVTRIDKTDDVFTVEMAAGARETTRRILLAYGLKDTLPPVEGIQPLWGASVFHCPYCDGWEVHDQPLAVYGQGETGFHQTLLLRQWSSDLMLCTNGDSGLSDDQRAQLERNGVQIIETPITRLESDGSRLKAIVFADGQYLPRHALFLRPTSTPQADFAQTLGCAMSDTGVIEVDTLGKTSVAGVYAAGDIANRLRSVAAASAQGSAAAAGLNFDLVQSDFT